MQRATVTNLRDAKKSLKIEISLSDNDLSFSEHFRDEIDHDSLHPNYKLTMSRSHEYLAKSDRCKVSAQIEKFLMKHPKLNDLNKRNSSSPTRSGTEQNESKELISRKNKGSKKQNLCSCSSACIIG